MLKLLNDFLSLFFPNNCLACGNSLYDNEKTICTSCLFYLPKTDFHLDKDNDLSKVFWGRAQLENVTACFTYGKGGKVQNLIHQLKYRGKKEIGIFFGNYYGKILSQSQHFNTLDYILPVPLHEKKQRKRGFNQSEIFAQGLSDSMNIPIDIKALTRTISSQTQTKKSRFDRWKNVSEIFLVKNYDFLENKHILLVDDVITTGATIEACYHALKEISGVKVSVAAIAYAKK
ncbi:ComF family protein [candidate division KSB1 bacterium]